jgi:hypothetical protein
LRRSSMTVAFSLCCNAEPTPHSGIWSGAD